MSVDLFGWVEVRDLPSVARESQAWSGFLQLHPLVGQLRQLFPCLYQYYVRSGPRALRYEHGLPPHLSHEMLHLLDETGLSPDRARCFTIPWASLAEIDWAPMTAWPHVQVELWWRDPSGAYQLKSQRHDAHRLPHADAMALLDASTPIDRDQYRYAIRRTTAPIDVAEPWLCLLAAMRHAAARVGPQHVRLVGFFA